MSFDIFLGLALTVCILGILYRLFIWFSQAVNPTKEKIPLGARLRTAVAGFFKVFFSVRFFRILQSFFADVVLQKRIFDKSAYRWFTHSFIFISFIVLFFFHAVGEFTFELFGSEYIPTLNPVLSLRNVFGLLALIGVGMAVYRRLSMRSHRLKNYASDWTALALVGVIMLSGFLLEGAKISSYSVYQSMREEYGFYDGEEAMALEAYWVAENGLHSPNFTQPIDEERVATGLELHQDSSCIECHVSNKNAFVSYTVGNALGPAAAAVGDRRTVDAFWFLHIAACLGLLAWLPFSKMFHMVSAPFSLAIRRVMGKEGEDPINVINRQMIDLSACTHCGACTVECSAMMFFESFQNDFILPSEKIQYLKKIAAGKKVDEETLQRLQKGLYICTSCERCTDICPSGINLKDIFVHARYYLLNRGVVETSMLSHFSFPLALAQKFTGNHLQALKAVHEAFLSRFKSLPAMLGTLHISKQNTLDNRSYASCYSCQRCTNICPVVRNYSNPGEALDMMPHQIIYSLGIGNTEMALGAQMIWSCSTCYLCQEHCPNQVELTDIFYRLKNIAINKLEAGDVK